MLLSQNIHNSLRSLRRRNLVSLYFLKPSLYLQRMGFAIKNCFLLFSVQKSQLKIWFFQIFKYNSLVFSMRFKALCTLALVLAFISRMLHLLQFLLLYICLFFCFLHAHFIWVMVLLIIHKIDLYLVMFAGKRLDLLMKTRNSLSKGKGSYRMDLNWSSIQVIATSLWFRCVCYSDYDWNNGQMCQDGLATSLWFRCFCYSDHGLSNTSVFQS